MRFTLQLICAMLAVAMATPVPRRARHDPPAEQVAEHVKEDAVEASGEVPEADGDEAEDEEEEYVDLTDAEDEILAEIVARPEALVDPKPEEEVAEAEAEAEAETETFDEQVVDFIDAVLAASDAQFQTNSDTGDANIAEIEEALTEEVEEEVEEEEEEEEEGGNSDSHSSVTWTSSEQDGFSAVLASELSGKGESHVVSSAAHVHGDVDGTPLRLSSVNNKIDQKTQ